MNGQSRLLPLAKSARPRRWRLVTLLLSGSLVAASCGGGGAGGGGGDAAGPAVPAEVQELVVGASADPWVQSEDDRKSAPNYPLNADVCETLLHLGRDYRLEPMLATEWKFTGDNTFRFTLNDKATFSDGRPLQAEDIEYTIDYITQEPSTGFSYLGPDSAAIVDKRTVDITPEQPNRRLVEQINHPTYSILSPGDDPLNNMDVTCTGPFEVVSYSPEQELVVQRNPKYWGKPARLDKITFRFYADDTTRVLALQNGEVDLITDVPQGILASLQGRRDIRIETSPVGNVTLMYVARRDSAGNPRLLNDPVLRRAVAASMDTKSFVNGVLGGNAEQIDTVAPPAVLGQFADKVRGVDFDPAAAERLLDQAGWTRQGDGIRTKDGQPLQLSIVYARVDLTVAEFVQAQLRRVGIDGQIQQLDPGAYRDVLASGNYDLDISQPSQNDANPAFLMALRWYSEGPVANAKIISPGPGTRFNALIDQTLTATDSNELRRVSAEAMHELVDVEVGGIPLSGNYRIFAMNDRVQGLQLHPSGTNQRWATVFMAQ